MAILHLLGTGAAVSDANRSTTMLAIENSESLIVIDCGGDVVQKLLLSGANIDNLKALIVTHEHADHISGFPLFMERMWLLGRREPVPVYGIKEAISQAKRMHETFDTSDWPGYPEIDWRELDKTENSLLLSDNNWEIHTSAGTHGVPVIGLRILNKQSANVVSYSCDTEYSESIVSLAEGSHILVHEASGPLSGHSTAADAARAAAKSKSKRLLLVHVPPKELLSNEVIAEARQIFANLDVADEGSKYEF